MIGAVVAVNAQQVILALGQLRLGLAKRDELLGDIGKRQMTSVYRTFDEAGSPAGSWPPLSPNSLRWGNYTPGHKLLMRSGKLRNSIQPQVQGDTVVIGTNDQIAPVHQLGFSGPQNVRPYTYTRKVKSRDTFASEQITNKRGRKQTVRRKTSSGTVSVAVGAFIRNITIPARPFIVFRPEDSGVIGDTVAAFVAARASDAGLEVS